MDYAPTSCLPKRPSPFLSQIKFEEAYSIVMRPLVMVWQELQSCRSHEMNSFSEAKRYLRKMQIQRNDHKKDAITLNSRMYNGVF